MATKKELIQFVLTNATNCDFKIPMFESSVPSINATTKYSWDITTQNIACGFGSIIINSSIYNFTYDGTLSGLLSVLNTLSSSVGCGFFCFEVVGANTFVYVVDDNCIFSTLNICGTISTTSTTTSTTTAPSTSTTTSTTTGVLTTSTTTSTTTSASTSTTTSTTTAASTSTTTSTTTAASTSTTTSTTTAPSTSTTTSTTTAPSTSTTTSTTTAPSTSTTTTTTTLSDCTLAGTAEVTAAP